VSKGRLCDDVDVLIGRNVRMLREDRGISQTELGRKIGVTFQQVQKYENGKNRIGSGRLFKIASVLGVPVTAFEGMPPTMSADAAPSPVALVAEPYALRLLQAFCALENRDLRRSLVEIVERMAAPGFEAERTGRVRAPKSSLN
jgi:transcriptional regulator with XRE-family HTH domain